MRKTHLMVLAIAAAAAVLAIGAVGAFADLASDATAPTTTTDAVAEYWDAATIVATATDDEGIAYMYHELDDGVVRLATIDGKPLSAEITIPTAKDDPLSVGTHTLKYWAQDVNGNVEAQQTLTFTIKPAPEARKYLASMKVSSQRTQRYRKVRFNIAVQTGWGVAASDMQVRLIYKKKGGNWRTWKKVTLALNGSISKSYKMTMRRGAYYFKVKVPGDGGLNLTTYSRYKKIVVR